MITEQTTKEQFLEDYKNYPSTGSNVEEKPFAESRLAPIFYEIPQGSKVLDVGCNDGSFMKILKEKRKCQVTGIDVSEVALAEAKNKALDVQIADVENMPFPDEYFDVVTCMEVLSHLFDPSKALKEMRRVLKKNGILLGSCPHKNLETYVWEDKRMHRRYFDENDLHTLLGESFGKSWIRILNGGQFSFGMATSFLGDKPCEMLFKSGKDDVLGWDAALQDRSVLRCWFGFTQNPGTVYYRMSGYADKMQKLGAETHYNPYDENDQNSCSDWINKIRWIPSERRFSNQHIVDQLFNLMKAADMSIFQFTASRDFLVYLTAFRDPKNLYPLHVKKPLILEADDWIFDIPSYNYAAGSYHPNSDAEAVAYDQLKLSDAVICSTQYLKEKFEQLAPGKPVYVVKNSLDFDIWDKVGKERPLHEKNPDLIRISFSGCGNHNGDIELIKKPLLALLEEFPNLEFISLPFQSLSDIRHPRVFIFNSWVGISEFPKVYASWETDIAIAPLRDNELNRAKSNLRWLESSAMKIPMVCSDVYPFHNSVKNGKDGILVSNSAKEWYEAMRSLIVDERERTVMGQNAYERVKKEFNMDDVSKSYLSILKVIKADASKSLRQQHQK